MQDFFLVIRYNLHPYDFYDFFKNLMTSSFLNKQDSTAFSSLPVYAVVLAGGKARRMHGKDKGLLHVNGRKLIDYTIENISPQVDHVFISANRHIPQYQTLGYPVLLDSFGDYAGPLAGILSALENIHEDALLLVVPCDMPALPVDLVALLKQQLYAEGADICCIRQQHRIQPLLSIMHSRVHEHLKSYLQSGRYKVQEWLQALHFSTVPLENMHLLNINSADELSKFKIQANHE